MAKRSGLGQRLYLASIGGGPAYDLSGDIGSIDVADCSFATIDDTGIDKSAHERIPGLGDGKLQYSAFWNNAAGGEHAVVKGLVGTAVRGIWVGSTTEGDGLAYAISGLLTGYPTTRAANGSLMAKPTIDSYNGEYPDWGVLLANATDASGTVNHTAVDFGLTGPTQTIVSNTLANPTVLTVTAHGYVNGDSVTVAGSNSTPSINGDWVVSNVTPNTFTVPVNCSVAGTAGTVAKTSLRLGATLTAVLLSIGSGTNYTLQWQTSADNGAIDTYTNVAGLVTTSLTAAAAESRVRSTSTTLVKRWNRLVGAGTYTNAVVVAVGKRIAGAE